MKNLKTQLQSRISQPAKVAVMGIGSELRGDDGAGVVVAKELENIFTTETASGKVLVVDGGTAPENFTGLIKKFSPTHIILIDAAELGQNAGYVQILDGAQVAASSFSTHRMPLSVLIGYLEHETGAKCTLIGIEPKHIEFAAPVTDEVMQAAKALAKVIVEILK